MKQIILGFAFLIFSISSKAQQLAKTNEKVFGGSSYDEGTFIENDLNGNHYYLLTSNSNNSGNKTVNSYGGTDFWLVKENKSQQIKWQLSIGGSSSENSGGLINSGEYLYAYGTSNSGISGNKTTPNYGGSDFWLIKIDTSGNIFWDKTFGGGGDDILVSAKLFNHNKIILGGTSNSSISGTKTISSKGDNDYYLIEVNANGDIQKEIVLGGSSSDNLTDLLITEQNEVLLCGISLSDISGDKSEPIFGGTDIWLVELDSLGANIKDKTIGGNNLELNPKINPFKSGFVVTSSSFSDPGTGQKNSTNYGMDDIWVLRLDFDLNVIWETSIGGGLNDEGTSIISLNENLIIVTGSSTSTTNYGNKSEVGYGESDIAIILLDSSGAIISDTYFGGVEDDFGVKSHQLNSSGISIISTSLSGASGNKTATNNGNEDGWTFDLSLPLNIEDYNLRHSKFSIYPNPVFKYLNLSILSNSKKYKTILIHNVDGKLILNQNAQNEISWPIDVSRLAKGTYIISLITEENEMYSKIFIR